MAIGLVRDCKCKCLWQLYAALGSGSQWGHPHPPFRPSRNPASASPIQLRRVMTFRLRLKYVCTMNHVPSSVRNSATYRITTAGVGEEPGESSCSVGQGPCLPGHLVHVSQSYQAQSDSQGLSNVGMQLILPTSSSKRTLIS